MSSTTKIEWCDATVNHWAGCTAISPACDNCYAKRMAGRLWGTQWVPGAPRHQFAGAAAALRALDRKAQRLGRPLRVFHNSLSDFFDNEVPVQWRLAALRAMLDTPNLIHLLLTKRIGNAAAMLETAFRAVHGQREGWADNVPANVWIGATITSQPEADRDIPKLLQVPARVRFLSMEPLLGPVDLPFDRLREWNRLALLNQQPHATARLDWIIVGGESGPGARPMHPEWTRSLRDQCDEAGVPFFFKQWGEHAPNWLNDDAGNKIEGSEWIDRMGKKAAGRLLDGRTHDGFPGVTAP